PPSRDRRSRPFGSPFARVSSNGPFADAARQDTLCMMCFIPRRQRQHASQLRRASVSEGLVLLNVVLEPHGGASHGPSPAQVRRFDTGDARVVTQTTRGAISVAAPATTSRDRRFATWRPHGPM